jgi:hypothetical protein
MRRLRSNSRKNRIYKVFREVGRSVRTAALLRYLAIREVMVGPQANRSALRRRPAWRSVHEPADPRAVWTERIALAPSPTAAATRFIDPDRTSPIAKTSGWLVSDGSGRRPS